MVNDKTRGKSLIELIVVIVIIAILFAVTTPNFLGRRSRQELDNNARQIVALLREAQSRSAAQEGSTTWGVHFDNSATPAFYALFKTSYAATNTVSRYPLPANVRFSTSSIASGSTLDITFAQISGTPSTSTSVTLQSVVGGAARIVVSTSTINVGKAGAVTY